MIGLRTRTRQLVLIALLVAPMAACGAESNVFASQVGKTQSWAPLPEEQSLPASAPDDPSTYRGVRYRTATQVGGSSVESDGRPVQWLQSSYSAYGTAGETDGPFFGYQDMFDGKRRMLWFFRLVEPPTHVPSPQQSVTTTAPRGSGEAGPATAVSPPQPIETAELPPEPSRAVLDVVVLTGENAGVGCGVDPVVLNGNDGWRLNRTTGRIEPVDPTNAVCPKEEYPG